MAPIVSGPPGTRSTLTRSKCAWPSTSILLLRLPQFSVTRNVGCLVEKRGLQSWSDFVKRIPNVVAGRTWPSVKRDCT